MGFQVLLMCHFFDSMTTRKTVDIGAKDGFLSALNSQNDCFRGEGQNVEVNSQGIIDSVAYG